MGENKYDNIILKLIKLKNIKLQYTKDVENRHLILIEYRNLDIRIYLGSSETYLVEINGLSGVYISEEVKEKVVDRLERDITKLEKNIDMDLRSQKIDNIL